MQICRFFTPWLVKILDHLDNTVRVARRCAGAWDLDNSHVLLHVRSGRRARRSARRGRPQPLDLNFLCDLGYLPEELLLTMQSEGTTFRLARSERCYSYGPGGGHLHVEEMEALVEYVGYQHVYWNLQILTSYADPLASDTESDSVSSTESEA